MAVAPEAAARSRACATTPSSSPTGCRRCWSPPSGSPPTVAQGVHGRRRVGVGETFWQFRPYQQGDSSTRIDWRQSARATQLFLRDQEWEAAESVWLWADLSASMVYRSRTDWPTKQDRATLIVLALASLLTRGGERVAWLGQDRRPLGGRAGMASLCEGLVGQASREVSLPPAQQLPRHARLVLVGDFFVPLDALRERLRGFVGRGVRGHLMQVTDPAEWSLPFAGRVQFEDLESQGRALIGNVDGVRERYRAAAATATSPACATSAARCPGPSPATAAITRRSLPCSPSTPRSRPRARARRCSTWACSA